MVTWASTLLFGLFLDLLQGGKRELISNYLPCSGLFILFSGRKQNVNETRSSDYCHKACRNILESWLANEPHNWLQKIYKVDKNTKVVPLN